MRLILALLLTSLALPVHAQDPASPTPPRRAPERAHGRSMVISTRGIVATSQVLASQAGAMILAKGGSAVDAAIAANAVLGLTEPMMDGIGGDLFVLYRDAKTGKLTGLNSSGPAPRAMTIEALKAKGLEKMAPNGIHSSTVPGCVRGWEAMHKRHGKLPWKDLFAAAVRMAEEGFPVYEVTAQVWDRPELRKDPESLRVFLPGLPVHVPQAPARENHLGMIADGIVERRIQGSDTLNQD